MKKRFMNFLLRGAPAISAALLIMLSMPAFGQTITTGDITGMVTDSSGAIVPNATVTVKSIDTNETRTATPNAVGRYRFTFLKPGRYSITATAPGLTSGSSEIALLVGQEPAVDLVLRVEGTQQTIEVTSVTPLVQTENANLATSFNQKQMVDLPTSGGDITNAAFTVPGITLNVGGGNANFNAHGIPFNASLFTLNGADINEPYNNNNKSGASNNTLGQNDIAEAAVILDAYSAQYGRMAGVQVNYITKSGTNSIHGNLGYSYNDAILNANGFFNNATGTPRGRSVANQYAASIGGRIIKDKTFFFVNTEGLRYALPSTGVVSVPSPQFEQYTLAHIPAASLPLYQDIFNLYNNAPGISRAVPVTNGTGLLQDGYGNLGCGHQTFPGTYVNGSSGAQFGVTVPCALAFGTTASSVNTESLFSTRVDHTINEKQRIFLRFSKDWGVQATTTSALNPIFNETSNQPWYIGQINHTYMISSALVNNFVANVNYYTTIFGVSDFAKAQSLMPAEFQTATNGAVGTQAFTDGGANGGGFANLGVPLPDGRRGTQYALIDDLSWSHGAHAFQVGVNFRRNRITDTTLLTGSQIGVYTLADLTDFANGVVNSTNKGSVFTQAFPQLQAAHDYLYNLGFYVQDEWSIRPTIKLTYGIRFERSENPPCKENCFSNLAGFAPTSAATVPYNSSIQTAQHNAFTSIESLVPAPRVGLVVSPFGQNKTVFRGGVGLFANTFPGNLVANMLTNSPNVFTPTVKFGTVGLGSQAGSAQAAAIASANAFQSGFAQGYTMSQLQGVLGQVPFGAPSYFTAPNEFLNAKVLEWSFEVEQPLTARNLLSVSYSGNHGYDESGTNADMNAYIGTASRYPNGFAGLPTTAPDARFATVTKLSTSAVSNYDGLSAQVRHAFSLGLQGEIGYTWSHSLQYGPVAYSTTNPHATSGLATVYDPTNTSFGYGSTDFDRRHALSADVVWNPPAFKQHLLESILGGWTVGTKLYAYSGRPFSVTNSQIPGLLSSTFGGQVLADLLVPSLQGTHCGNVNVRCLTASEFATSQSQDDFGNIPPNSFRGPGYFDIDAQLTKKVPIREHMSFQFGASAFNLLNNTSFANPNSNVASGSFGLITSAQSAPTSMYGTGQGALVSNRVLVVTAKFTF